MKNKKIGVAQENPVNTAGEINGIIELMKDAAETENPEIDNDRVNSIEILNAIF